MNYLARLLKLEGGGKNYAYSSEIVPSNLSKWAFAGLDNSPQVHIKNISALDKPVNLEAVRQQKTLAPVETDLRTRRN